MTQPNSHRRRLSFGALAGLISVTALLLFAAGSVFVLSRVEDAHSAAHEAGEAAQATLGATTRAMNAKELRFHVVQVQQWLTDI